MTPPVHYFTARTHDDWGTDTVFAFWPHDGTLAQRVWTPASIAGGPPGHYEWVPVRGPDYATIRAELTHPERTVPAPIAD